MEKNMNVKEKLLATAAAHPKLTTFALGLAVTFAFSAVLLLGSINHTAWAFIQNQENSGSNAYCC